MDEFDSLLPPTTEFQCGYFCGKQSTKYWLMCLADVDAMNKHVEKAKGSVMLWCDARSTKKPDQQSDCSGNKRKKSDELPPSKRRQIEEELDTIVEELKEKHGNKYTLPQFRCWARMISSGKYDDTDNIPAFLELESLPKKSKRTSLADAITDAANTFAKAVNNPSSQQCENGSQSVVIASNVSNCKTTTSVLDQPRIQQSLAVDTAASPKGTGVFETSMKPGISPGKITDLRMKKLQELRELQGLLEQNILTQQEFVEQKTLVLDSLRKLTH